MLSLLSVLFTLRTYVYSRLLPYANLVVGNEDEFRALAERAGIVESCDVVGGETISSIARKIADLDYVSTGNQFESCRLADFQGNNKTTPSKS